MSRRDENEEIEDTNDGELRAWLHAEALEALTEVNDACLELLADQSMAGAQTPPMLRELAELWRALDPSARRRAAACPYLLLDAGFSDAGRWRSLGGYDVSDRVAPTYGVFFTVPRATEVARLVFTYAWHVARTQHISARMLLGMPAHCAPLIAGCTLRQIQEFARRYPAWLRPRWPSRIQFWREFLLTAAEGEGIALEQARIHGLQLLAGEVRSSMVR